MARIRVCTSNRILLTDPVTTFNVYLVRIGRRPGCRERPRPQCTLGGPKGGAGGHGDTRPAVCVPCRPFVRPQNQSLSVWHCCKARLRLARVGSSTEEATGYPVYRETAAVPPSPAPACCCSSAVAEDRQQSAEHPVCKLDSRNRGDTDTMPFGTHTFTDHDLVAYCKINSEKVMVSIQNVPCQTCIVILVYFTFCYMSNTPEQTDISAVRLIVIM